MPGRRWYRVEYHAGADVRVIDRIPDVYAHHTTLSPYLSHLLLMGVRHGKLVLIDEATGLVVARRPLQSRRRRRARR